MTPREAAAKVVEGFDTQVFVRNTRGDNKPEWSIRLLPYLSALAVLKEFADGSGSEQ